MNFRGSPERCQKRRFGAFRATKRGLSMVAQRFIRQFLEGQFSEVRQKNPLACDRYSHTAMVSLKPGYCSCLPPLRRPPKRLPGAPGTPIAGSIRRSRPHQPATRQARTSRMATRAISGLAPAVPANRKLAFMNTPKKAAMPVNAPRMRAIPTRVSPRITR